MKKDDVLDLLWVISFMAAVTGGWMVYKGMNFSDLAFKYQIINPEVRGSDEDFNRILKQALTNEGVHFNKHARRYLEADVTYDVMGSRLDSLQSNAQIHIRIQNHYQPLCFSGKIPALSLVGQNNRELLAQEAARKIHNLWNTKASSTDCEVDPAFAGASP